MTNANDIDMSRIHETMPNVEAIRADATRVIRGRIPAQVRKEL